MYRGSGVNVIWIFIWKKVHFLSCSLPLLLRCLNMKHSLNNSDDYVFLLEQQILQVRPKAFMFFDILFSTTQGSLAMSRETNWHYLVLLLLVTLSSSHPLFTSFSCHFKPSTSPSCFSALKWQEHCGPLCSINPRSWSLWLSLYRPSLFRQSSNRPSPIRPSPKSRIPSCYDKNSPYLASLFLASPSLSPSAEAALFSCSLELCTTSSLCSSSNSLSVWATWLENWA